MRQLEREICGAKSLATAALVPKIERLDSKVAKIDLLPGFLGYQVGNKELNQMVAKFLLRTKPVKKPGRFSVLDEIKTLRKTLVQDKKAGEEFKIIESALCGRPLYPVHGDLQKQNIVVVSGTLGLIDFEHFTFAPKELEFCNSLFFNDGNCLDVAGIIGFLPVQFIDKKILEIMVRFYAFRQVSLGMNQAEAADRLVTALDKIAMLPLEGKQLLVKDNKTSFCYI